MQQATMEGLLKRKPLNRVMERLKDSAQNIMSQSYFGLEKANDQNC